MRIAGVGGALYSQVRMSTAIPVLAWGWHGLTPTILFDEYESTKSTGTYPLRPFMPRAGPFGCAQQGSKRCSTQQILVELS